jgi:hypothetical protein|tara:strand:+ start:209 stop:478 length:270 start_codon:yes stop_codon:yes gene_type:complete
MNRLILIALAITALMLGSQFVKAQDDCGDYNSDCYGLEPYGSSYPTYGTHDRPEAKDTLDIMLENQDRQQIMRAQSDRQLQKRCKVSER